MVPSSLEMRPLQQLPLWPFLILRYIGRDVVGDIVMHHLLCAYLAVFQESTAQITLDLLLPEALLGIE